MRKKLLAGVAIGMGLAMGFVALSQYAKPAYAAEAQSSELRQESAIDLPGGKTLTVVCNTKTGTRYVTYGVAGVVVDPNGGPCK